MSMLFLELLYFNATNNTAGIPSLNESRTIEQMMPKTAQSYSSLLGYLNSNPEKDMPASRIFEMVQSNKFLKPKYDELVSNAIAEAKNIGATVSGIEKDGSFVFKFSESTQFGSFVKGQTANVLGLIREGSTLQDQGLRLNVFVDRALDGAGGWFGSNSNRAYLSGSSFFNATLDKPNFTWSILEHEIKGHGGTALLQTLGMPDLFSSVQRTYENLPAGSVRYSDWGFAYDEIQTFKMNFDAVARGMKNGDDWALTPESKRFLGVFATNISQLSDVYNSQMEKLLSTDSKLWKVTQDEGVNGKNPGVKIQVSGFEIVLGEIDYEKYSKLDSGAANKLLRNSISIRAQEIQGTTAAYKEQVYDGLFAAEKSGAIDKSTKDNIISEITAHEKLFGGEPELTSEIAQKTYQNVYNMQAAVPEDYLHGVQKGLGDAIAGELRVSEYNILQNSEARIPQQVREDVIAKASNRALKLAYASEMYPTLEVLDKAPVEYIEQPGTVKAVYIDEGRMATLQKYGVGAMGALAISSLGNITAQLNAETDPKKQAALLNSYVTSTNENILHIAEISGGLMIVGKGLALTGATVLGMPAETAAAVTTTIFFTGLTVKALLDPNTSKGIISAIGNYKEIPGVTAKIVVTEMQKGIPFFRAVTGLITMGKTVAKEVRSGTDLGAAAIKAGMKNDAIFRDPKKQLEAARKAGNGSVIDVIAESVKNKNKAPTVVAVSNNNFDKQKIANKYGANNSGRNIYVSQNEDGSNTYTAEAKKKSSSFSVTFDSDAVLVKVCPECKPLSEGTFSALLGKAAGASAGESIDNNNLKDFVVKTEDGDYDFRALSTMRAQLFTETVDGIESIKAGVSVDPSAVSQMKLNLSWLNKGVSAIWDFNASNSGQVDAASVTTEYKGGTSSLNLAINYVDAYLNNLGNSAVGSAGTIGGSLGIPTFSSNDMFVNKIAVGGSPEITSSINLDLGSVGASFTQSQATISVARDRYDQAVATIAAANQAAESAAKAEVAPPPTVQVTTPLPTVQVTAPSTTQTVTTPPPAQVTVQIVGGVSRVPIDKNGVPLIKINSSTSVYFDGGKVTAPPSTGTTYTTQTYTAGSGSGQVQNNVTTQNINTGKINVSINSPTVFNGNAYINNYSVPSCQICSGNYGTNILNPGYNNMQILSNLELSNTFIRGW